MIKLITIAKGKSVMTPEEFSDYWYRVHGPLFRDTFPQVKRYVQNHILRLPGIGKPQFDGAAEFWFDNVESWRAFGDMYRSDHGKAVREDEEKFIDRSKMVLLLTEEKVIKP